MVTEQGGQYGVYAAALYRALILQFQGRTKDTLQRPWPYCKIIVMCAALNQSEFGIDNRGILNNINYFLQSFALEMA